MKANDLTDDSALLQSILVFKCMKECDPSSFMQRFVAGAENHEAHMSEMAAKKNECSLGCVQAIRMAQSHPEILKKYTGVINADPADFSVQTKEQNKRKILAYRELSSELEDKCMFSCVDSCKAAKGTTRHGKGANVVDGEMACIKNCTKGCEQFFDLVKTII